jgi:RNA polymerase primary sigma factor
MDNPEGRPVARTTHDTTARRRARHDDEPDLVGQYLAQIGSTRLLTADEEVELAKRIEAGVYAAELLRAADAGDRRLTAARRLELTALAADGRAAKDHMIRANLRLVVSAARKHARRGVPFLDVVQEGNLGLIRAVEKFDYAKGFKFSTYAMWWIRQAIERGLAEQSRTVRLPAHVAEVVSKLNRIDRDLNRLLGREPTVDEIAAEAGLPADRVVELRQVARDSISLDTPVGDDGETTLGELIEDSDVLQAADIAEQRALTASLRDLVASLPPREATIINLRFGLADGQPHTLQEVADRVGLTRERVRQLEKKALAELRAPERNERLLAWAS